MILKSNLLRYRLCHIVPGVYAPGLAKHAKHVPLNDSLANRIEAEAGQQGTYA